MGHGMRMARSIAGVVLAVSLGMSPAYLLPRAEAAASAQALGFPLSPLFAVIPVHGDGGDGLWRLGVPGRAGRAGAAVTAEQTPNCAEGPCPGTMGVLFDDGTLQRVDDEATIAEIGRVDAARYLVAAGFCYQNCVLRLYAIDTGARTVSTLLDRTTPYFPIPTGACGFSLRYRGRAYTARAVPHAGAAGHIYADWHLYAGTSSCT